MRTWAYRIATLLLLGAFFATFLAAYKGWGLSSSAATTAERNAVRRTSSVRVGSHLYGGGTHYGK